MSALLGVLAVAGSTGLRPATGADGVMVFIGIVDAAVEAALRDGFMQCSVAAGTVAPTSSVD
ncbi:hypothetical protein VL15_20170 [Burkholderia cepacia]|uniref:Uncharacterized protein n=1 Tax=Burkholderia cepacia TaxID=292 RepID=A0A0J5WJE6_BURCE|nr:hypothetical protein [Burkholderia cepacia]KML54784.1 hypothetical protein VL15_20170 [Burkholderia cepacia]